MTYHEGARKDRLGKGHRQSDHGHGHRDTAALHLPNVQHERHVDRLLALREPDHKWVGDQIN